MGLFKFKSRKDGTNAETSAAKSEGAKKESKEISGGKRKNRIDGNAKEKKRCKNKNEGGGILSFDDEEEDEFGDEDDDPMVELANVAMQRRGWRS